MEERTTGPAFTRREQRVNQLAAQYVELVNSGQDRNSERLTALSTQIWLGTVEAMERTLGGRALDQERRIANSGRDYEEQDLKMELLTELIMNGLTGRPGQEGEGVPRFDPERAPWLVYIAKGMKWKQSDFIRRERDGVPELTHGERQRIREADPDRRDEVRRAVYRGISALSLDVPMGEEEATLGDLVQDPEGLKTLERVEEDSVFASMACELAAKVFLLQQERGRSVRKDVVIAYYQLFFTDNVTQMAREGWLRQVRHPRELFRSMDLDFLDHCMTCVCRTLTELGRTALKAYRLLVPKRDSGAEPPLPLPTDVYQTYVALAWGKEVTTRSIDLHRQNYRKTMAMAIR